MAAEKTPHDSEWLVLRELTTEEWTRLQEWAVLFAEAGGSFTIEGPTGYLVCNRDGLRVMSLRDLV